MHGAEGVNAMGTELLDQFNRPSFGPQGSRGEGRKSGGTSLRPVTLN